MRRLVVLLAPLLIAAGLAGFSSPAAAIADRDCGDFDTQRAAQRFFLNHHPKKDPHRLDADGDGRACESLPCPCGAGSSGSGGTSTGGGGGGKKQLKQRARVISVTDGDTIKVRLIGGPRRNVRFIGIDTPEVYGGVECGGPRASRALKRKLKPGNRVLLVSDPSQDYKDRWGRLIRYVMKNGRDINRSQVWGGFSKVYVYDSTPFRRVSSYRKAQRNAKSHNRALWRCCW